MYDDYDLDYTLSSDYASSYDLDEMCENHVSYNMIQDNTSYDDEITSYDDDEYRDEQDYQTLAYMHYAWYNSPRTPIPTPTMIAQKRTIRVILDIECYDDLDIESQDWREILQLEGDEDVHATITDLADIF